MNHAPIAMLSAAAAILCHLAPAHAQHCQPRWSDAFSHIVFSGGDVRAILRADIAGQTHMVFTGHFLQGGTIYANGIVRHTETPGGEQWDSFGSGLSHSAPPPTHAVGGYALAVYDDGAGPELYIGGIFDAADGIAATNIARWNGTTWSPLGAPGAEGTDNVVRTMAVYDDGSGPALYIGGLFNSAGGQPASRIARYQNGAWSTIGALEGGNGAYAMTVHNDGHGEALFIGGDFTSANGIPAYLVARYQGSGWSAVGDPLTHPIVFPDANILAMTSYDLGGGPALFVGGRDTQCALVLQWNGVEWSRIGCLGGQFVSSIVGLDDGGIPTLFAGGYFGQNMARYRSGTWLSVNTSFGIRSLLLDTSDPTNPTLLAGGAQVIRRVGGAWAWYRSPRGITSGNARAIATRVDAGGEAEVFIGGTAMEIAGVPIKSVGRWHAGEWSSVGAPGTSIGGDVNALEFFDAGSGEQLYAAGSIDLMPGLYFARLNGESWELPLALPISNPVHALHAASLNGQQRLYIGGEFRFLGQTQVNGIFEFDGTAGVPLGTGLGFQPGAGVRAIADFDDGSGAHLYVGGNFEIAGGLPARSIARWDGTQWRALREGVDGEVAALASMTTSTGPRLFVGGRFPTAGTASSINIAAWDGAAWHALPPQFTTSRPVTTLNVLREGTRERLLVGAPGPQIWDGEIWTALTEGQAPRAVGIIERPGNTSDVYILGSFTWYGDRSAAGIAMQHGCPTCYPNCDNSALAPVLNIDDFTCFINEFAAAQFLPHARQIEHYANCDGSQSPPALNVDDFTCFINSFAAGCP